ncbi:MAG: DUF3105 domain-containing protein [Actinomycetota bacterium]
MSQQQTKKEKREAAKQARIEAQKKRERAKKRKRLITIAIIVVVALAGTYLLILRGAAEKRALASELKSAGCSQIKSYKIGARDHIQTTAKTPNYNSNPPTSGPHLGQTSPWGSQDETVDKKMLVHNLEHGGIVVHYKGIAEADADKVAEIADSYSDGVISQPNDELKDKVAMAAWGKAQTCEKVSERVIRAFIKERCNKGPEKFGLKCGG